MNDVKYEKRIDEIVDKMLEHLSEYSDNPIDDLNIVGKMNEKLLN